MARGSKSIIDSTGIGVIGAGQIGQVVAAMLSEHAAFSVVLADKDPNPLPAEAPYQTKVVDARDATGLREFLGGHDVVASACPYYLNTAIAEAALDTQAHYFDLTEDVPTTQRIRELAEGASVAFIPQSGLAPRSSRSLGTRWRAPSIE